MTGVLQLKTTVLIAALCGIVFLSGCQATQRSLQPSHATSFNAVTSKLDADGDFYLYLNTNSFSCSLNEKLTAFKQKNCRHDKSLARTINYLEHKLDSSGLTSVAGFGASSITIQPKLNHHKIFIYNESPKATQKTFWHLLGRQPHRLKTLEMLPANTVLAGFMDVDITRLNEWFVKSPKSRQMPALLQAMQAAFENGSGVSLDDVLASLDDHAGFFVTFQPARKTVWPIHNRMLTTPEPAFALVLKTKNEFILNYVYRKLKKHDTGLQMSIEDGVKMVNIRVPVVLPPFIQPILAQKDELLVLGSNSVIVRQFFEPNITRKLVTQPEFFDLAMYMPLKGNGFKYVSSQFSNTLKHIQLQAVKDSISTPGHAAWIDQLNSVDVDVNFFGILQIEKDGYLITANSNASLAEIMAVQGLLFPAALTSLWVKPSYRPGKTKE